MNNELISNPGAAPPSLSSLGDFRLPLPKDYYIEFLLLGAFSGLLLPAVILPILLTVLPLAEPVTGNTRSMHTVYCTSTSRFYYL